MDALSNLFSGMRTSSQGLSAERQRMDVIAENIANARTTQTAEGGPYRRQMVRFQPLLERAASGALRSIGVAASEVVPDYETPMDRIFDPSNPDADADGMVTMPNVNATLEMADLVTAMRAYEANLTAQENFTRMAERALRIAS